MKNSAKLLILMTIALFAKFYVFRFMLFGDKSLWSLLSSESGSLVVFLSLLAFVFNKKMKTAYLISNAAVSLVLFSILVYFSYYGKIPTYEALLQIGQVGEVHESVSSLIKPSYFLVFADFLFFMAASRWLMKGEKHVRESMALPRKYALVVFSVVLLFSIGKVKAEKSSEILNENKRAEKMGILTYQINSLLQSKEEQLAAISVSRDEIQQLKGEPVNPSPKLFGIAKNKNVIVIQLEAFQNFLIGLKVDGVEVTPNLNCLIKESYYFPHVFQQVGMGNTSDAEYISNSSLYPVGDTPMSQQAGDRYVPSLPKFLEQLKYKTMTFHANDVKFWQRDQLYPALGFSKYYDLAFFGQEEIVGLGPSDDVLYRKSLPVLEEKFKQKQPFYAQFVSMSGHHPFTMPAGYSTFPLPASFKDSDVGHYLMAQHYTDAALGRFFEGLKQKGIWDESVIVIYGDHYGLPHDESATKRQQLLTGLLGREYDRVDMFNIPLIIKVPGVDKGSTVDIVGGQLDIMPTVANLLGVSLQEKVYFGRDLLNASNNLLGVRFYLPTGSFFTNEILFTPGYGFEDGIAVNIRTHEKVEDFSGYRDEYERVLKLLHHSDAYTSQLPKR